jgi:hypothetical protein
LTFVGVSPVLKSGTFGPVLSGLDGWGMQSVTGALGRAYEVRAMRVASLRFGMVNLGFENSGFRERANGVLDSRSQIRDVKFPNGFIFSLSAVEMV